MAKDWVSPIDDAENARKWHNELVKAEAEIKKLRTGVLEIIDNDQDGDVDFLKWRIHNLLNGGDDG